MSSGQVPEVRSIAEERSCVRVKRGPPFARRELLHESVFAFPRQIGRREWRVDDFR
jgi:hypothetical protein